MSKRVILAHDEDCQMVTGEGTVVQDRPAAAYLELTSDGRRLPVGSILATRYPRQCTCEPEQVNLEEWFKTHLLRIRNAGSP